MTHRKRPGEAVWKRHTAITLAALSTCALTVGFTGMAPAAPRMPTGHPAPPTWHWATPIRPAP